LILMLRAALACLIALCTTAPAGAQQVALAGLLGSKALLVINSGSPRSMAVGDTYQGIKLVSLQDNLAVIEKEGQHRTLRLGESPASVGGAAAPQGGNKIILTAGTGGHFYTQGQINGRSMSLMVDTGATLVSLSMAEATRIGLNFKSGPMGSVSTANGVVTAWQVKLANLRLGEVVVYDVDAVVTTANMPFVLLGNSFLGRFQMTRNNDQMVLDKRF